MSRVTSTLRRINGKLFGGRNQNEKMDGRDCDRCFSLSRDEFRRKTADHDETKIVVAIINNQEVSSKNIREHLTDDNPDLQRESKADRRNFEIYVIMKSLEDQYIELENYLASLGV